MDRQAENLYNRLDDRWYKLLTVEQFPHSAHTRVLYLRAHTYTGTHKRAEANTRASLPMYSLTHYSLLIATLVHEFHSTGICTDKQMIAYALQHIPNGIFETQNLVKLDAICNGRWDFRGRILPAVRLKRSHSDRLANRCP